MANFGLADTLNTTLAGRSKVCLRIVPVKVHSWDSKKELLTYAGLSVGFSVAGSMQKVGGYFHFNSPISCSEVT